MGVFENLRTNFNRVVGGVNKGATALADIGKPPADMTRPPADNIPTIVVTPDPTPPTPGQYPYGFAPSHTYRTPEEMGLGSYKPGSYRTDQYGGTNETAEEAYRKQIPLPIPPPMPEITPPPPPPVDQPVINPDSAEGGRQNTSKPPFKDIVEKWLQPNPLNKYWHPAYHFRLFMTGDKDLLDQAGSPGHVTELLKKVNDDSIPQVIIAESGVTGYNIKDVEIETVDSMNANTRRQQATEITMTITEPMGISFLDAIAGAGTMLGVWDYTKMTYFLQLSFTGYDEDGKFASNPLPLSGFQNGGRWIWALTINQIETKLNEGGGVYTIRFVTTETELITSENRALKAKQILTPKGDTLKDLFDDYANEMTKAWEAEYGKTKDGRPLAKFKIVTHPVHFPPDPPADISTFKLTPQQKDKSQIRSLDMEFKDKGKPVINVAAGTTVNDFIISAIISTEQGQALFKDGTVTGQPDMSPSQTNPKSRRVSKLFSIEPDIRPVAFDKTTGNYIEEVTIHVTPRYSDTAILSRVQVEDAKEPETQREIVESLGKLGFMRKRYEYIFTGLNTEVIDFDLTFNMAFQPMLPKAAGYRMNSLNNENHGRRRDVDPTKIPSKQLEAVELKTAKVPAQANAVKAPEKPTNQVTAPANMFGTLKSNFNSSSFYATAANASLTGEDASPKTYSTPNDSTGGKRIYIEEVLSRLNQGQATNVLPVSFTHGYLEFMHEAPATGPYHPDRPLAATVLVQQLVNEFQEIKLTIRGDPYWLGETNLDRQILLRKESGQTHFPEALPNFITGAPNIILYFRYPLQMGDDFKPVLKDSMVFNGVYQITQVKHTFSEGTFKQVLTGTRSILVDLTLAYTSDPYAKTNDQGSPFTADAPGQSEDGATSGNSNTPGVGGSNFAPSGGPPSTETQRQRAQESYDFWTKKGYSPAAAAGMVAQEEAESSFNWKQTGDSGAAKGAFQWHQDRRDLILAGTGINVADPNTTHEQQLEAAHWEQTKGQERKAGEKIRAATSGGQAGDFGSRYYERPLDREGEAQKRAGRGQYWENHFNKPKPAASNTTTLNPPT